MSDLISRQDAIEAMCGECLREDNETECICGCAFKDILSALPSAMREPTKEERESVAEYVGKASTPTGENFYDLISRSDAKQQISEWATIITNPTLLDKDATMVVLDKLPSAEAEQLWVPVSDIRKLQDILLMKINSFEGTRNIVEKGMLEAWKDVAEYISEKALSTPPSAEAVQGCDGCRYNTQTPQEQCLRCKRYWRDSYERKGGGDE